MAILVVSFFPQTVIFDVQLAWRAFSRLSNDPITCTGNYIKPNITIIHQKFTVIYQKIGLGRQKFGLI